MILIGTAGHIDHGKTTLLKALTGIDPTRLPEEIKREMTVDLGYAWMEHPNGHKLSFIDVPGHEKLIRNMSAGAASMRAALLVIDAKEGPREQTIEHFRILELLGVKHLIPVITKIESVNSDQIQTTLKEISTMLSGTVYSESKIFEVDSISGTGLEQLKQKIFRLPVNPQIDSDLNPLYLSVDRSFQLKGLGTVVTGSLVQGFLEEGQEVKLSCLKENIKIRSLHNHNEKVKKISAGNRAGIQLPGAVHRDIKRGTAVVEPDNNFYSAEINARIHLLDNSPVELKSGQSYLIYSACMEHICQIWVCVDSKNQIRENERDKTFSRKNLKPGNSAWVQILLKSEIYVYRGQRFIIRSTNPLVTIAGGEMIDCSPCARRKMLGSELEAYSKRNLNSDSPEIHHFLCYGPKPFYSLNNLSRKFIRPKKDILKSVSSLSQVINERGPEHWNKADFMAHLPRLLAHLANLPEYINSNLSDFKDGMLIRRAAEHFQLPEGLFRAGIANITAKPLNRDIGNNQVSLIIEKDKLFLRGITIEPEPEIKQVMEEILQRMDKEGPSTTLYKPLLLAFKHRQTNFKKAMAFLKQTGEVVEISKDYSLLKSHYNSLLKKTSQLGNKPFTVSDLGRACGISRKYSIPLAEFMDRKGITQRDSNFRTILMPIIN